MYKKIFVIAVLIILISCGGGGNQSSHTTISSDNITTITQEELIDKLDYSVECIPLENNGESVIGSITATYMFDNLIFVLSSNMSGGELLVFDGKGAFLNKIGAHGRASNEYLKIKTFAIDKENKHVVIVDSNKQKFLIYDFLGNYISSIDGDQQMKFISKMEQLSDGSFLVSYGIHFKNSDKPNPLFAQYSPELNECKNLVTTELYFMGNYSYSNMPFSINEGKVVCIEPLSNNINSLSSSGIFTLVNDIAFDNTKPITRGDYMNHFASIGKYISEVVSYKNYTIIKYPKTTILFDNRSNRGYRVDNSYELEKFGKVPLIISSIVLSDEKYLYSYITSENAIRYIKIFKVDDKFRAKLEDLDSNSNPILLKFKL